MTYQMSFKYFTLVLAMAGVSMAQTAQLDHTTTTTHFQSQGLDLNLQPSAEAAAYVGADNFEAERVDLSPSAGVPC